MKQTVQSIEIVCDGCGEVFVDGDNFRSFSDDPDGKLIEGEAVNSDWLKMCNRHYCPECYNLDDNDVYHTKDGRKFDGETHKLIEVPVNPNELKPGDVLAAGECIFIYKGIDKEKKYGGTSDAIIYYACTNVKDGSTPIGPKIGVGHIGGCLDIVYRMAYTDEREHLFSMLRKNGYEWNAEELKLVKI